MHTFNWGANTQQIMSDDQNPLNLNSIDEVPAAILGDLSSLPFNISPTTLTSTQTQPHHGGPRSSFQPFGYSTGHNIDNITGHDETNVLHEIFQVLSDVELHGSQPSTSHSSDKALPISTGEPFLLRFDELPVAHDYGGPSERDDQEKKPLDATPAQVSPSKGKEVKISCPDLEETEGKNTIKKQKRNTSEYKRRARIHDKLTTLQKMVPGSYRRDQASILEDVIKHVKALQQQLDMMSMTGATPSFGAVGPVSINHPSPPTSGYAFMVPTLASPATNPSLQQNQFAMLCPPIQYATTPQLLTPLFSPQPPPPPPPPPQPPIDSPLSEGPQHIKQSP